MKNLIRSNRRWKIYALLITLIGGIGLSGLLAWMTLYSQPEEVVYHSAFREPPSTLAIVILEADVIARVRLSSVSAGAELFDPSSIGYGRANTVYVGALEYEFEVLEYLKGSGSRQIAAVANGYATVQHKSEKDALARGKAFLAARDTSWDDREAIVFLTDSHLAVPSTQQPGRYWIGATEIYDNGYTINSGYAKKWLPAASVDGASGASGSGEQRFLTDAPGSSEGAAGAAEQAPSTTLAALKSRIAGLEASVAVVDGSAEYRDCVIAKHEWERDIQYYKYIDIREEYDFESGLPAGRRVYEDKRTSFTREYSLAHPEEPHAEYWLEGRDKDLFYVEHPGVVFATRPLPKGEYQMYYLGRAHKYIICDAYPESERTRFEYVVQVIPPSGTLHEAFFDPVDIGAAVGADGENGVLKPASFEFKGNEITVERIEWVGGQVKLELAPHGLLTGHHIDFIALDGEVSLRLDFDDAVEVTEEGVGARALVWGVCKQPWEDGGLLMLRLSESGAELEGATNDAECAATPEPTATPTATPTPEPTATPEPEPTTDTPPAPQNLIAVATHNSITLTWDAPADASELSGYRILRRIQEDAELTQVADIPADAMSYGVDPTVRTTKRPG